ncbi:MAG TPA: M56 family metallopeptidase [Thermoanaerobaculia bacterium]|nr:M56 family metallopeptidase [Thermoanaerobaculia bacterium]
MLANQLAGHAIAWLLTYLLHGTLLLGLAWLVSKPLARWSVSAEETVWKLALVGALFTASLQVAAGWEPVAGRWGLADFSRPAAPIEAVAPATALALPVPGRLRAIPIPEASRLARAAETPAPVARLSMPSVPALALGAWALGACLLLAGYSRSYSLLRRRLKDRPRVVGGTLHSQLRVLAAEAGFTEDVRLSCSSRVPVPLALGLRRSEICVPPKALAGLTKEQQEGMLAHELAHLVRRDPLWLVLSHVLTCVFFFQPLNWVARRRLREISEMLSDEWAVSRTGRPLSLAGCLAEVAGWSVARRSLPVPSMADRPSNLAQRIRRLLDDGRSPESPARRIWLGAAMVVLLIVVAAAAPAVSVAREEAREKAEAPVVAEALATVEARVAEAVEPVDAVEPAEAVEPGERQVAEQPVIDRHVDGDEMDGDEDDSEVDIDVDDMDFDFDFDFDADSVVEGSLAAMDVALESMDAQLDQLDEISYRHELSEEEQEKLEAEIDRANDQIERTLRPQMEKLSRELSEKMSKGFPTAEMHKLQVEMERLGEQLRPSHEEMARLQAQMDEQRQKYRADGDLSREERERMVRDARRMAEQYKPSEEQRREMQELARRHRELGQKYRDEHRDEIEKATREMREAVDREMRAVSEELRRTMEQRRLIDREERRERSHEKEMRKDRDRKDPKRDKEKPKVSGLRVNPWGSFQIQQIDPLGSFQLLAKDSSGC